MVFTNLPLATMALTLINIIRVYFYIRSYVAITIYSYIVEAYMGSLCILYRACMHAVDILTQNHMM